MTLADALRSAVFHDVSPLIDARLPVFPGHPPIEIDREARTHARDGYFLQRIAFGEHVGSHVDAPAHAVASLRERTIDQYAVGRFIAPYVKYDLSHHELGPGDLVTQSLLQDEERGMNAAPGAGDVAIVQFGWDRHFKPKSDDQAERDWWIRNAPGLAEDACDHLAALGIAAVGSDTATGDAAVIDGRITSDVGHMRAFLPAEILLFEGLVGLGPAPARGIFVGLPLKIRGGSGSPIRAVLIEERA
ncbi:MAG TPA: cyclase family protein [Gaiellaceae bacterium]|nr:cyclase family protein [Gaiellaceae bacterium]